MKSLLSLFLATPVCFSFVACTSIEQKTTAHGFAGTTKGNRLHLTKRGSLNSASMKKSSPKPANQKIKPRPKSKSKQRTVRTTAYCHLENEPGAYGNKNAIGTKLKYGTVRSAAADWSRYPLGTQFKIVGKPHVYEIDDFGSALVGTDTIDLYKPTLGAMNDWGVRHVDIEIVKWGCYNESASILEKRTKYWHCREMYEDLQPKIDRKSTNPSREGSLLSFRSI